MSQKEKLSDETVHLLKVAMAELQFKVFAGSGTTFFNDTTYEVRVRWDGTWTVLRSEHGTSGYWQNGNGLKNLAKFLQMLGYSIKPFASLDTATVDTETRV